MPSMTDLALIAALVFAVVCAVALVTLAVMPSDPDVRRRAARLLERLFRR